ncbi:hypothetical protein NQZ79_g147 [Umbelopsis isabellina]|nr:hypothetical protein NQZ79_g147 [Umbelopsis isabellina]
MFTAKAISIVILASASTAWAACQIQAWTCDRMYDCHIDTLPLCASEPADAAVGIVYQQYEGYPYNIPDARIGYSYAVAQDDYANAKTILDTKYPGKCTEHTYKKALCNPPQVTVCGKTL